MFGILRPQRQSLYYRRLYARLCQHYRESYGLRAIFWLNYETLFLYAIAYDLGLLPTQSIKDQQCCRLRRDPTLLVSSDHQLGFLLASIGLLLGSLKVDDDLRDKPRLASRMTHVLFQNLFRSARKNLVTFDPDLQSKLTAIIHSQNALEAQEPKTSLQAFCQPTVSGFTAIFDKVARQLDLPTGSPLSRLAAPLARAVVSFDQAIDFERDKRGEGYTVLSCEADRLSALDHALQQIEDACATSSAWLGPQSLASEILDGFRNRIENSKKALQCPPGSRRWHPIVGVFRTFYWSILGSLIPASAMAATSNSASDDDWCTFKTCCCFCLGVICGEEGSRNTRQ